MVKGVGFNCRFGCGEDAKGYDVHSSSCEDNGSFSLLRKSRLDSSSFLGDIHNKGTLTNPFMPIDTIITEILSSMGFCVG